MLATVYSKAVVGIESIDVRVEVDVSSGLPAFEIVGLPGTAVKEARDRVRAAIRNSGYTFPLGRVTVNLSPAHIPKADTHFDLPIAVGILAASSQLPNGFPISTLVVIGELSLDGSVRSVIGAMCVAESVKNSQSVLIAPQANQAEVEAVPEVRLIPVGSLNDLVHKMDHNTTPHLTSGIVTGHSTASQRPLWCDLQGQEAAKRALEIALAGGHHVLMFGPPGAGKTMLARGAGQLAPPLTPQEALTVSQVYSVAGLLSEETPFILERPFRSPHHHITAAGLLGGGRVPKPGEVSLAHNGILFLDEFPEFSRTALEGLRQPTEEGFVTVARLGRSCRFPASFSLIAAANPCPCGYYGDPKHTCLCRPAELMRYRRRLSGPLIDRIDLFIHVERPDTKVLLKDDGTTDQARIDAVRRIQARIQGARIVQERRFEGKEHSNAKMTPAEIAVFAMPDEEGRRLLDQAARAWALSPRAIHRVLKVARTIADIDGRQKLKAEDVAEALAYRMPGHSAHA